MERIFAVGDVQGCFTELLSLIRKIGRQNIDQLWLTGDIVNRGPESLETLRWCMANQHWVRVVLGNHDLNLLAVCAGIRAEKPGDTIAPILSAPDKNLLINWLREQPLIHHDQHHLMVHAGLLPQWSAACAVELGQEISNQLKNADWKNFLSTMYGNTPVMWHPALRGADRARVIINAMTRLRFCTPEGGMEFASKEGLDSAPSGYYAWFDIPNRAAENTTIIFGHWATLGLVERNNVHGIDTGCVWGRLLTAIRLSPGNELSRSSKANIIQVPKRSR